MEWDRLKIFYHIAKAGSFCQAAKELNITQPALSRNIKLLEYSLKTKLFERLPRGVSLTHKGAILYQHASEIWSKFKEVETSLLDKEDYAKGPLQIISSHSIASAWLVKFIPGFLKDFPEMDLTITSNNSNINLNFNTAEVALCPFISHDPDLMQNHLTSFHMKLYASPKYLEEFGTPEKVEDLDEHRLIAFGDNPSHPYVNWMLKVGRGSQYARSPFLRISSSEGLLKLASAGLGIVELAEGYPEGEKADLVQILPDVKGPIIKFYYIFPKRLESSKRVIALGEYIKGRLDENP